MKTRIPPPILFLVTGAIMTLIARSDYAMPFSLRFAPGIAALLAACGALVIFLAMRRFHLAETTVNPLDPESATTLVSDSIFSVSRNPMYLGLLLMLVAWSVGLGSLAAIGVMLVFVFLITELQIKPEEAALRNVFGEDYDDYCSKVRRWI